MPYYAVVGETVVWLGFAGNATEAVRLHMDDVAADSYVGPIIYEIPEPPEGWQQEGPKGGFLSAWVDENGTRCRGVGSQVRIDNQIYDADAVFNLMDPEILEAMAEAGVRCEPLTAGDIRVVPLDEFVRVYRELHADKFGGEMFRVG